jgi:hypothetical protein
MDSLWRVRWQFGKRSGYGSAMSRIQALAAAARSNAIDPATVHRAEPISDQDVLLMRRSDLLHPVHYAD